MNAIAKLGDQTMLSKDLLEIINTVRAEMGEPTIRLNKFNEKIEDELEGEYYTKSVVQNMNNTTSIIYELTLDQCTLIGMRESKSVRKNVLAKLKAKHQTFALPQTFSQALALAAEQAKQLEEANAKVELLEPKAIALDTIADTTHTYTIREVSKTIGIREKDLISLLLKKKWCYRDADKKLQPHADKREQGVFINRPSPVIKNQYDGQERVFLHMRVTAFGLTRITGLVNKEKENNND